MSWCGWTWRDWRGLKTFCGSFRDGRRCDGGRWAPVFTTLPRTDGLEASHLAVYHVSSSIWTRVICGRGADAVNQVNPSEQVVGRVASLSRLVARPPRGTLVRGLTQERLVVVLTDCDWLVFTVVQWGVGGGDDEPVMSEVRCVCP